MHTDKPTDRQTDLRVVMVPQESGSFGILMPSHARDMGSGVQVVAVGVELQILQTSALHSFVILNCLASGLLRIFTVCIVAVSPACKRFVCLSASTSFERIFWGGSVWAAFV